MGTLNITLPDGRSGTVQVDDGFASLPPDKQAETIDQIKASLAPHNSFTSDVQGGLHDLGTSASQGLQAVGGVMSRNGMPEWGGGVSDAGKWVADHTPSEPPGPSPSDQLAGAISHSDWGSVPGLVMHSAVRAAPSVVPILGAEALGGPAAAIGTGAAMALGPEAYGRAANNGRQEPSTADVVGAIPSAALEGAGAALIPGGSKVANPIIRGGVNALRAAAGGAVMDIGGQLGASVGTDKGAQFDPYQTAGAALTQGAMSAGRHVPDIVGAGVKNVSDNLMARTLDAPASPADAQSVLRVNQAMEEARQNDINSTGKPRPDTAYAATVRDDLYTKLMRSVDELRSVGLLDPADVRDLRTLIETQAYRAKNTITEGSDGLVPLFDRVDTMNIPEELRTQMKGDIRDLNTVSSQSFLNRSTGPFQMVGNQVGRWGGAALELSHGNIPGAVLAGALGHGIGGRVGGAVGAGIDRMLGTNTPPVVLQRLNALRVLKDAGIDPASVAPTGPYDSLTGALNAARAATAASSFNDLAARDQAALDSQAKKAEEARQAQEDAAWKANEQRQKQVDDAYAEVTPPGGPDTSALDAYLTGKLDDPSLLPPDRTLSDLATQNLRLANARARTLQAKQQAKLWAEIVKKDAKAPYDDVGNPIDPIPANTPLYSDNTPIPQAVLNKRGGKAKAALQPDTPETVQATLESDNPAPQPAPASAAQARLRNARAVAQAAPVEAPQAPPAAPAQAAPVPERFPSYRYLMKGTGMQQEDVQGLIQRWADARAAAGQPVPDHELALLHNPTVSGPRAMLDEVKNWHFGQRYGTQLAPSGQPQASPEAAVSPEERRRLISYEVSARAYQGRVTSTAAKLEAAGHADAAAALTKLSQIPRMSDKAAFRAMLPPEIAAQIPDWAVQHGGK